jgi:hypothetical protein
MDSFSSNALGCNCCNGKTEFTPVKIANLPGQSNLSYRVGTFSRFKRSMIAHLSSSNSILLDRLTTRDESNDLANAILDSTAIVLDVLTFYQERIANEGFLQTAIDRRSILELAGEIGYQLRQGVAASTFLAFSIENAPGSVDKTTIPIGSKVQTLPSGPEMPQVFETTEEIEARPEWNNLKPKLTVHQTIDEYSDALYLKGVATQLNLGDGILIMKGARGASSTSRKKFFRMVAKVEPDVEKQITKVSLLGALKKSDVTISVNIVNEAQLIDTETLQTTFADTSVVSLSQDQKNTLASSTWNMSQLAFAASRNKLETEEFANLLRYWAEPLVIVKEDPDLTRVFAMRTKAGIFGSNAPGYRNLPETVVGNYLDWDTPPSPINKRRVFDDTNPNVNYDKDRGNEGKLIYLDNIYSAILPSSSAEDSWVVLKESFSNDPLISKISQVIEENLIGFSLNSRVTGLKLDISSGTELERFHVRTTTVYAKNEELQLADVPSNDPIKGNSLTLEKQETHLNIGQYLALTGTIVDENNQDLGFIRSEVVTIAEISIDAYASTTIKFKENLINAYQPQSVVINANIAKASHGQTKSVTLGGGDPSMKMQSFLLREKPLTFVSFPNERGAKSTLEIYVDDIRWIEALSLSEIGPFDRAFVTRVDNDSNVHIFFGDGVHGKLPSAGLDNIRARYRIGTGLAGIAKTGQISILLDRPADVKNVTNPVPAEDAADPETIDMGRENAPLTVLTLGRIVSLTDYENFASAFAGIVKAHATWIWSREERIIYLTIASEGASPVEATSELYKSLVGAINKFKDPTAKFQIGSFVLKLFNIQAGIFVTEGYTFENVKENVEESLINKFSFKARQFGQAVAASEIIATIQHVEGVEAVDLDYFYLSEEAFMMRDAISVNIAHWDDVKKAVIPAEIAILNTIQGAGGLTIIQSKRRD